MVIMLVPVDDSMVMDEGEKLRGDQEPEKMVGWTLQADVIAPYAVRPLILSTVSRETDLFAVRQV